MEETNLHLLVTCRDLPGRRFDDGCTVWEPVFLGIQRRKEIIDLVPGDAAVATFTPVFRVKRQADGTLNFLGPFAQGTRKDRFFYLVWCVAREPEAPATFRRLKVRLGHLTWHAVEKSRTQPIEVALRLTDARGGPLCATPSAGHIAWRL